MPSPTEAIFKAINQGDTSELQAMIKDDPGSYTPDIPIPIFIIGPYFNSQPFVVSWMPADFSLKKERRFTPTLRTPIPPVMQAAWGKHQDVVDYFLKEIPDKADGTNKLGVTLNLAARQGWIDIVRKHLKADPLAVHQRGWIGDTCLHWPSHNNYADILVLLLDAGADIEADEINWMGGKPLHWASEHAPSCVDVLLRRGAQVSSRNEMPGTKCYGMTPLIMNATQKDDCAEVCELLLEAGADIHAKDAAGKTDLEWAKEKKLKRITSVLENHS